VVQQLLVERVVEAVTHRLAAGAHDLSEGGQSERHIAEAKLKIPQKPNTTFYNFYNQIYIWFFPHCIMDCRFSSTK
jgi:hypothetical protein